LGGPSNQNKEPSTTENRLSHAQAIKAMTKVMGRLNLLKGFIVSLRVRKRL